jgi:hypothetical protein
VTPEHLPTENGISHGKCPSILDRRRKKEGGGSISKYILLLYCYTAVPHPPMLVSIYISHECILRPERGGHRETLGRAGERGRGGEGRTENNTCEVPIE